MEGIVPLFRLTLENTYYSQSFFNVTVDFDGFTRPTEGPVELVLGTSGLKIESNVNRRSNQNESARIMGGSKLRDWFQENYSPGDVISWVYSPVERHLGWSARLMRLRRLRR
jgi:hypothetical protein